MCPGEGRLGREVMGFKFLLPPAGLLAAAGVFGIGSSPPSPSLDLLQEQMLLGKKTPRQNPKPC